MLLDTLYRAYNALFHPDIKLQTAFPWTIGKMLKTYAIGTFWFFAGSFLPVILLYGYMWVGAYYHPSLLDYIGDNRGNIHMWLLSSIVISSFLLGFGAELLYIRHIFNRDNLSLSNSMAFNLNSLKGSWSDAWLRATCAFLLAKGLCALLSILPWPPVWDPAAEFAKTISGTALWCFVAIIVLGAPFFEEIVFRGFLFNVLRSSFRQRQTLVTTGIATAGCITAITMLAMQPDTSAGILAALAVVVVAAMLARRVFTSVSPDVASDYLAILISAALFAAFHLNLVGIIFSVLRIVGVDVSWVDPAAFNVNLTVFPEILLMGMMLAALYRRSGTLVCPMLMHGLNNLVAILVLCMTFP